MDKLENTIMQHREQFDSDPDEGHLQRFEERLNQMHQKHPRKWNRLPFLRVASIVIILLLSANLLMYWLPNGKKEHHRQTMNNELTETASFYTVRINSGLNELKDLVSEGVGNEKDYEQVRKELGEMDQLYQDMKKEYSNNPNDERVINAMIEYYQTKLEIINTIKTDLEKVKSLKNKNNENTSL
ncbi:MAG: hypothetical protein LWW85_07835 [Marinilabiliales bacterium]|nr:hypothetical protein [Marinilabiliales bacterium]